MAWRPLPQLGSKDTATISGVSMNSGIPLSRVLLRSMNTAAV